MHEASLMKNLMAEIERLAEENEAERVIGVKVALGALSHFTKEHFQEHFEFAAKNTKAEGAKLQMILLDNVKDPNAQHVVLEGIDFELE